MKAIAATDTELGDGYGAPWYRNYVLIALLAIYVCDVIDRILFALVQEPIKVDLHVSDFQLGLLGGPAFAVLYSLTGLPIAHLADKSNRVTIVTLGISFWSFATSACGIAGSYMQLVGLRVLVGIGEAACIPPSHSLISDYFPVKQRGSALAVYGLAIPIGSMIAAVAGGWITAHFGWRQAFVALGVPGLLIALIVKLTVKEPPRTSAVREASPAANFKLLLFKPTFFHMSMGGALMAAYLYPVTQFLVSFMVRRYSVPLDVAAMTFGLIVTVAMASGIFLGGYISDALRVREPRLIAWLPVIGCIVSIPLFLLAFSQAHFIPMVALISAAMLFAYFYFSPTFTVAQIIAGPTMRASASALLLLISTLIGYGLGPPLAGWIADRVRNETLISAGLSPASCDAAPRVAQCVAASAHGLQMALIVMAAAVAWAAVHFWMASRSLHRDRVD